MRAYSPEELAGITLSSTKLESDKLERKLGLFSVIIISLSSMIGSGLFLLPSLAMVEMGGGDNPVGGVWIAYLLAAFVVLPSAISKSELATAMPSSGGSYLYVERTFGPLIGTISGLGLWANFMLKSAFALIGFKAYLWVFEEILAPNWERGWLYDNVDIIALALLGAIVGINILGVKSVKKIQIPIVMFSSGYLLALCLWAMATMDVNWDSAISIEAFGGSWTAVASTSAFVFVSYAGVTKIAAIGGEIKQPSKNLPYGILLSLLFSCALYVTVTMAMTATVDPIEYMGEGTGPREDPIYVFAKAVGGETIANIAAFLAVVTMTSMALAGILASSRFPFAMSRDKLMPEFLEEVHGKFGTPYWAIIVTGLAVGAAITFLPVKEVAKLASGFKIMIFMLINAVVIVLRKSSSSHKWYSPGWETPSVMYPFIQLFGIFGGAFLLYLMGSSGVMGASGAVILGLIIFNSYGKNNVKREITPWDTALRMITDPEDAELRRRYAAFYDADSEDSGILNMDQFISAILALGYIKRGGANIPDDSLVISSTKTNERDQTVRDLFIKGDSDSDGSIDIHEFIEIAEEIAP